MPLKCINLKLQNKCFFRRECGEHKHYIKLHSTMFTPVKENTWKNKK